MRRTGSFVNSKGNRERRVAWPFLIDACHARKTSRGRKAFVHPGSVGLTRDATRLYSAHASSGSFPTFADWSRAAAPSSLRDVGIGQVGRGAARLYFAPDFELRTRMVDKGRMEAFRRSGQSSRHGRRSDLIRRRGHNLPPCGARSATRPAGRKRPTSMTVAQVLFRPATGGADAVRCS
jgi:hypothetical protein